jgi:hypothetical protein
LDLTTVDALFDKWYREEEALSTVLNMKVIKQKNVDLRSKLEAWKRRLEERKRLQKRAATQYQKLKTAMERHQEDFNMEKERVIACVLSFIQFYEDKEQVEKDEKIINDFLCQLPDGGIGHQILEIKDLERVLDNEVRTFKQEGTLLREFAATVRAECVMEQNFFSFYDIPDLIVKKKYTRKDYEGIIKMLNKVKKAYLLEKADILKDKNKPLDEIVITDEDLVPLDLFDKVLQNRENKQELKRQSI